MIGESGDWPGELRFATDADAAAVTELVSGCFAEYPGCVLDPRGMDVWMAAPATYYTERQGQIWVLSDYRGDPEPLPGAGAAPRVSPPGTINACVGWAPLSGSRIELKNLYVSASKRRQGLGRRLVALVERKATQRNADEVLLWSDTRFLDAHRLYSGLGYRQTGAQRAWDDPSHSIEYEFIKALT